MSLLNISLSRDVAHVYVDTMSAELLARPGQDARTLSRGEASKLVCLPDSNTVLAGRGTLQFFGMVVAAALTRYGNGFDGLAAAMPEMLARCFAHHAEQLRAHGFACPEAEEQEIALAGWSEQLGSMSAGLWMRDPDAGRFEDARLPAGEVWAAPWCEAWGPEPVGTLGQLEAMQLAARQVAWVSGEVPQAGIGGRLLRAEVTRHETRVEQVCSL